jgi:hypothetical protein
MEKENTNQNQLVSGIQRSKGALGSAYDILHSLETHGLEPLLNLLWGSRSAASYIPLMIARKLSGFEAQLYLNDSILEDNFRMSSVSGRSVARWKVM